LSYLENVFVHVFEATLMTGNLNVAMTIESFR